MIFRKATKKDADHIVYHIMLAMESIIYEFIGIHEFDKACEFLCYFVAREDNQYSYQNWIVGVKNTKIVAAANVYDGAKLETLRGPIIAYVQANFNADFHPEDETQAGEYYIDTLSVIPKYQGKGLGTNLLQFLIEEYVKKEQHILGLLVDDQNPNAKKLYLKLGFKSVGKKMLVGKKMEHLQIK